MTNWVNRINQKLDQDLMSYDWPAPQLGKAMHYAVCNGGKRTRSTLSYLVGTGLGLTLDEMDSIAMAIECLHAYTLVHDDLPAMDDDDWRRHQPSCHKAFDEATAILAGDALQAHAFYLLAKGVGDKKIEQLIFFAETVGAAGLCSGQSMDMSYQAHNCDLATLYRIHHLKTGVLLGAACRLPAIASAQKKVVQDDLQAFGEALGILLQINDDLIDKDDKTGKTAGKDQTQNKATFGLDPQKGREKLEDQRQRCQQILNKLICLNKASRKEIESYFLSEKAQLLSSTQD